LFIWLSWLRDHSCRDPGHRFLCILLYTSQPQSFILFFSAWLSNQLPLHTIDPEGCSAAIPPFLPDSIIILC
jgi:hypothetical protein